MSHSVIENLLQQRMGLNPESIGSSAIAKAVERRMLKTSAHSVHHYCEQLKEKEQELMALIEEVVVPETWFFRDRKPFIYFRDYVANEWLTDIGNTGKSLRILSIPCSRGEEPYSLAMVLKSLKLALPSIRIDAIDISNGALEIAKRALYGENSFRGDDLDYRDRFFSKIDAYYELSDEIKSMVHFSQGNIFDESWLSVSENYDVIFCRNLLIYFNKEDQLRVIQRLHNILADSGILFVGHAEPSQIFDELFIALRDRGAFAYKKMQIEIIPNKHVKSRISHNAIDEAVRSSKAFPRKNPNALSQSRLYKQTKKDRNSNVQMVPKIGDKEALTRIRNLADRGMLQAAEQLAEEYLNNSDKSAEVYYLLGLIKEAKSDYQAAVELFKKAAYLNANHHGALVHLSLHADRRGEKKLAEQYKKRAKRAEDRSKK